ncbi:MAG: hypothetical protein SVV80_13860 [Planctomycetota bacterium]|nr:hypothetical protein [Planctomycetota bacterium]
MVIVAQTGGNSVNFAFTSFFILSIKRTGLVIHGQKSILSKNNLESLPVIGAGTVMSGVIADGYVRFPGESITDQPFSNQSEALPVRRPFNFVYWFTAPVGTLSEANTAGRAFEVADPSKSLRLDIIISPKAGGFWGHNTIILTFLVGLVFRGGVFGLFGVPGA